MIKYQKKFRIYTFLIRISCSSLLLNNKKSFLHPPNNKISKEISYLYHISRSSLLSNNKKSFYTLLITKYQKNFISTPSEFISYTPHSFSTIKIIFTPS